MNDEEGVSTFIYANKMRSVTREKRKEKKFKKDEKRC